jgi:COMPASS component SPP1
MLQLLDMALSRREAAIASGRIPGAAKDFCGYDTRLIVVGTTHQFGEWLATPEGGAIFRNGKLEAPEGDEEGDPLTASMCMKKKCKAHAGWGPMLTKTVRHDMKEWAAEAKGRLEREQHVRASAARRWMRKQRERNSVEYLDGGSD